MAKEHLGLALALNLPVMCVVTKIDMTPPNVMKETLSVLGKLLRSSGVRKLPLLVQEHKHAGKKNIFDLDLWFFSNCCTEFLLRACCTNIPSIISHRRGTWQSKNFLQSSPAQNPHRKNQRSSRIYRWWCIFCSGCWDSCIGHFGIGKSQSWWYNAYGPRFYGKIRTSAYKIDSS